jgi:hypothetical protein
MKICIWRYEDNTRNYPGYHLSADAEGCRALRERLGQIRDCETFTLTAPDTAVLSVPNNQGGRARCFAGRKLQVHTASSLAPNTFRWEEQDTTFILTYSREQISRLLAGVADIEKVEGDCSMRGDGDQALWFWWQSSSSDTNEEERNRSARPCQPRSH